MHIHWQKQYKKQIIGGLVYSVAFTLQFEVTQQIWDIVKQRFAEEDESDFSLYGWF